MRIDRSRLGTVTRLGVGGQGVVYAAPSLRMQYASALVFKEYKPHVVSGLDVDVLEAMPAYLETLQFSDGMELLSMSAWPCRLVEESGSVVGFVMPAIPSEFFIDMKKASGTQRGAGEFQHLLNGDSFLVRRQILLHDRHRFELLADTARGLAVFHSHGIAVGDLSPKNLLFSLAPHAKVFFIDCDAMRLQGRSVMPQLETPGWEVRAVSPGEELGTEASDSYKLALLALRLFAGDQSTRDPGRLPSSVPTEVRQLVVDGLSKSPAARPAPDLWIQPLVVAAASASTSPPVLRQPAATPAGVVPPKAPRHPAQPTPAAAPATTPTATRPPPVPTPVRYVPPRSWWQKRPRAGSLAVAASVIALMAIVGNTLTGGPPQNTTIATEEGPEALADGVLRVGYLLPETGPLAFLAPTMINAFKMAVQDVNHAGGVLGNDVETESADDAGDPAIASGEASRLLSAKVDAVIGPATSGSSLAVIEQITQAGVAQCSGSATNPVFTDYHDNGLYFRTVPTDALQGLVLSEMMLSDGHRNVVVVARQDGYGKGILDAMSTSLEEHGATVAAEILYDPDATTFHTEVQQILDADPDAVGIVAFEEGVQILQGLIEGGFTPDRKGIYGADGLRSNELAELVDPNNPTVLMGVKGTAPSPEQDQKFIDRLMLFAPDLEETFYAAHVYDCVVIFSLAAVAAGSDDPSEFSEEVVEVTRGGTKCHSFEACVALLDDREDIDYDGPSGALEFIDAGEPDRGTYELWSINREGRTETIDIVEATVNNTE